MDLRQVSSMSIKRSCVSKDIIPSLVCTGEQQEKPPKPLQTDFSYGKSSPEIDAVMKSNMALAATDDIIHRNDYSPSPPSPQIRLSRHIYSPVPCVTHSGADSAEFPLREGSDTQILISPSHENKAVSRSGISFPAIKVECCDGEFSASGKVFTAHNVTKNSIKTMTGLAGTDSYRFDKNQSLLVPSTLVRRRSTDGRLMVGFMDHLVEPNLVNFSSKAWSRSEGNIPVMSSGNSQAVSSRHPAFITSDVGLSSGHPRHMNFHGQNVKFGTSKTVLEPIRQNKEKSEIDQKSADTLDSTESLNNLDNLRISTSRPIDKDLKGSKSQSSNTVPKPRAKSISPGRLNQLEPLSLPGSTSPSELKSYHGGDARMAVRFLSPQPRRKLMPLYRENPDLQ